MKFSSISQVAVFCAMVTPFGVFAQNPAVASQAAAPMQLNGMHRFYRVNDHLYRSGQPTLEGLQGLTKLGIKTVIDLRAANPHSLEAQTLGILGIRYVNIPMPTLAAPSMESVKQTMALLTDQSAWPILLHCERGADRTGTVIACFRISQEGWSNQRALEEASQLGMLPFQKAKKQFILDWHPPSIVSAVATSASPAN
jgi:tyrosine-protein phosphatase SIW14